ncbi:MAG: hypothetical protein WBG43_11400 [Marinifilaceae bacterium]
MRFVRYILALLIIIVTLGQECKAQVGDGLTPYVRSCHRYSVGNTAVPTNLYLWRIKSGTNEAVRFITNSASKTNDQILKEAVMSFADYVIVTKNSAGKFIYVNDFPMVSNQVTIDADFVDKTKARSNFEIYILWLKEGVYSIISNEFNLNGCYTKTANVDVHVRTNPLVGKLSWNSYSTNEISTTDFNDNAKVICVEALAIGNVINFELKALGSNREWEYTYRVGVKYSDTQVLTTNGTNTVLKEPSAADWAQTADTHGHDWTHLYSPSKVVGMNFVNINVTKVLEPGESYVYIWVKIFLMKDGFGTPVTNPDELVRCAVLKQLPKKQNMILD